MSNNQDSFTHPYVVSTPIEETRSYLWALPRRFEWEREEDPDQVSVCESSPLKAQRRIEKFSNQFHGSAYPDLDPSDSGSIPCILTSFPGKLKITTTKKKELGLASFHCVSQAEIIANLKHNWLDGAWLLEVSVAKLNPTYFTSWVWVIRDFLTGSLTAICRLLRLQKRSAPSNCSICSWIRFFRVNTSVNSIESV